MELQGINLNQHIKSLDKEFTSLVAINLLVQMLDAIGNVHKLGFVHRDIQPKNFLMGRTEITMNQVYLVNFRWAKEQHLVGSTRYASINAHQRWELNKRDDLMSFFFILLEFLGQPLKWKQSRNKLDVFNLKMIAFKDPVNLLFPKLADKHP